MSSIDGDDKRRGNYRHVSQDAVGGGKTYSHVLEDAACGAQRIVVIHLQSQLVHKIQVHLMLFQILFMDLPILLQMLWAVG